MASHITDWAVPKVKGCKGSGVSGFRLGVQCFWSCAACFCPSNGKKCLSTLLPSRTEKVPVGRWAEGLL